jgi:hypothetical protein
MIRLRKTPPEKGVFRNQESSTMMRPEIRRIFVLGVLGLLVTAGTAPAQNNDTDLRRENQRLRTQVSDLRIELEAARNRIEQLEREVEQLRQLLAAAPQAPGTAPLPTEEEVTIDESVPTASPRALLGALKDRYREAMQDLDPGDPSTAAGNRQRTAYLRDLHRWSRRMNRELKSPIEWHIRIAARSTHPAYGTTLEVQAVDPKTRVSLGDPFPVSLPPTTVRRLRQMEQRGGLDVLVLKGVLVPQVAVNPLRPDQGLFDNPRFIGPFAEFGFFVEASSLTRAQEEQEPPQRTTGRS